VNELWGPFVIISALKIHMSENAHNALEEFQEFITEFRGDICVKVNTLYFMLKRTLSLPNALKATSK